MRIRVERRCQREIEKEWVVGIDSPLNKAFGLGEEVGSTEARPTSNNCSMSVSKNAMAYMAVKNWVIWAGSPSI
jgi:hypothetical protein